MIGLTAVVHGPVSCASCSTPHAAAARRRAARCSAVYQRRVKVGQSDRFSSPFFVLERRTPRPRTDFAYFLLRPLRILWLDGFFSLFRFCCFYNVAVSGRRCSALYEWAPRSLLMYFFITFGSGFGFSTTRRPFFNVFWSEKIYLR